MPASKLADMVAQALSFAEWAASYFALSPEERLELWQLLDEVDYDAPLLSRPARLALARLLLSLPVSLTIALYLYQVSGPHPMAAPTAVGITAIVAVAFLFASNRFAQAR